jgi:hypothetical protein
MSRSRLRNALTVMLLALSSGTASAESGPNGVFIGGNSASAPDANKTCVQVQVKGQKPSGYNCLNQELQQQALGANPPTPQIPSGASSPSNAIGTFNEQSLREQYGQNFGKSVIPYRPPPPVFNNPLH